MPFLPQVCRLYIVLLVYLMADMMIENDAMEIDHDIKALEEQIYNQTKNLHDLTTQQMNTHKLLASQQFIP